MKRSNGWMFVGIICIVALVAVNTAVLAWVFWPETKPPAKEKSSPSLCPLCKLERSGR